MPWGIKQKSLIKQNALILHPRKYLFTLETKRLLFS